jgi:hypothetical protein
MKNKIDYYHQQVEILTQLDEEFMKTYRLCVENVVINYLKNKYDYELISYKDFDFDYDRIFEYMRYNTRGIELYILYDYFVVNTALCSIEPTLIYTIYKVERQNGRTCGIPVVGQELYWGIKHIVLEREEIKINDILKKIKLETIK